MVLEKKHKYPKGSDTLKTLAELFLPHYEGVDALHYRANHPEQIDLLNNLERDDLVKRENDIYRMRLTGLVLLSDSNEYVGNLISKFETLFNILKSHYKTNQRDYMKVAELASLSGFAQEEVKECLSYMIVAPVWAGHSTDFYIDKDPGIRPSEEIVKYNNFQEAIDRVLKWSDDRINARLIQERSLSRTKRLSKNFIAMSDVFPAKQPALGARSKKKLITFETAFDIYTAVSQIGEGGAGRIYKAKDKSGDMWAVKLLDPEKVSGDKVRRFKNELTFCLKNEHANIVTVTDHGVFKKGTKSSPFYVMKLYDGSLRTLIRAGIATNKILAYFGQLLDGVEAAHLLKVTHRDLKPENILYDSKSDLLVVADFGIAHFEEEEMYTAVETKDSTRLANFQYAAPEQRGRGNEIDRRADIYALGLILNEMFTRDIPQGVDYKTVGSVAPDYAYIDDLIKKMIQQKPETRIFIIEEIKRELIARKNEFIVRQQLDEARKKVISVAVADQVEPVRLIGVDYQSGNLTFELSRVPEPGWIQRFQQPKEGFSEIMGKGPVAFQFSGKTAVIPAREAEAQQLVNNFKQYIQMATRGYQSDIATRSAKEEAEQRRRLERELAEAETRARVLKNIKI